MTESKKEITKEDASRIQSASDKSGENKDFSRKAQSIADKNKNK